MFHLHIVALKNLAKQLQYSYLDNGCFCCMDLQAIIKCLCFCPFIVSLYKKIVNIILDLISEYRSDGEQM